jgi:hypothetical protein
MYTRWENILIMLVQHLGLDCRRQERGIGLVKYKVEFRRRRLD